ncbi:MAG: DUF6054 family protein [Oscillospiraceae bacterium]|nr:DUF6054 family protein [Oscillospiraceae bacterium]
MDFRVNISPADAVRLLQDGIARGSISGTFIDQYVAGDVCVMVFEKYFMRTGARVSLTVTVHPAGPGLTAVHSVGSGGSKGALINFDWGASGSFVNSAEQVLAPYIVR